MIARITMFVLVLASQAACRSPAAAPNHPATTHEPTQEAGMISKEEAIQTAREALQGKVDLSPGGGVEVVLQGDIFIVTFTRNDPPGTRGPDYDARVKVHARTGKVTELLGSS